MEIVCLQLLFLMNHWLNVEVWLVTVCFINILAEKNLSEVA